MPKVMYNPEKAQKQKRVIGAVAITLMLIVAVLVMIFRLSFYVWILLDLVIFGVASLLLRRAGKVPL
ncbi:MAG: hypothetical protein FWE56_05290 [Candidatus Bathyarchaeota archaeon]|nr:hypothetical protein [Candidatus Termiticorpusculum sp.]MCL2868968.1 hypothetical protein [Candidatus Termiticorpusculum sp.]